MKAFVLLLFCILFFCASCGPGKGAPTPEKASEGFIKAMGTQDFETAMSYTTDKARKLVLNYKTNINMSSEEEQRELLERIKVSFEQVKCEEQEGKMQCQVCCDANKGQAMLHLVKQNDIWFVEVNEGLANWLE